MNLNMRTTYKHRSIPNQTHNDVQLCVSPFIFSPCSKVSLLGKSWHPKHLVCTSCKAPLLEEDGSQRSIYNQDGFPFCSKEHGKQWKTGAGAIVHVQLKKKKKKDKKKDKKKSKRSSGGKSAAEEAQELAQARRKREAGGSGDDNDEEEGPSRVCHVCVAELEENHRFCPFCGASQAAAGTAGGAGGNAVAATLKTEMSRLRRQVKDLEDSLKRERSLVSALQKVKQAGGFGGGGGGRVRFDEEEATTQDETKNSSSSSSSSRDPGALAPPPLSAKAGGPPPAPPLASDEDDDEWDEWDLDADAVEMTPQEALFVPVIEYLNEEGISADTITALSNDGVHDLDSLRDLVEMFTEDEAGMVDMLQETLGEQQVSILAAHIRANGTDSERWKSLAVPVALDDMMDSTEERGRSISSVMSAEANGPVSHQKGITEKEMTVGI